MVSRTLQNKLKNTLSAAKPKLSAILAASAIALAPVTSAYAQATSFSGYYALNSGNWHIVNSDPSSNGYVTYGDAIYGTWPPPSPPVDFNTITISGPTNVQSSLYFYITAPAAGTFGFSFLYGFDAPGINTAGYLLSVGPNSFATNEVARSDNLNNPVGNTQPAIQVQAGQQFGFYVLSTDNVQTYFVITQFSAPDGSTPPPTNTPEPSSLWLLGVGVMALASAHKRNNLARL